jgi:hypothetical protein
MSADRAGGGPGVALLGGLLLAWGGSASWVQRILVREVGGVPVRDVVTRAGTEFAPLALPLGVALLVVAGIALLARGRGRRVSGLLLLVLGAAGAGVAGIAVPEARAAAGTLSAAPWAALAGGLAAAAGGVRALRTSPSAPLLDERYTVEGRDEEGEWALAADEPDDPAD